MDVEDEDVLVIENRAKILHMEAKVLNKSKKLKKTKNYAFE